MRNVPAITSNEISFLIRGKLKTWLITWLITWFGIQKKKRKKKYGSY